MRIRHGGVLPSGAHPLKGRHLLRCSSVGTGPVPRMTSPWSTSMGASSTGRRSPTPRRRCRRRWTGWPAWQFCELARHHRTPGRTRGGAAAGRRSPGIPGAPHRLSRGTTALGCLGAKSDPGDSYKLADYLRTDGHRLRRLRRVDAGLLELQSLTRLREDHVRVRSAAINQLAALLDAHWPGPRRLFCSLASPIALQFLTDYPTPETMRHVGEARLAAFLRRNSYRGGKSAAELLRRLRSAPIATASLPAATLTVMIHAQVQLLSHLVTQIRPQLIELPGVGPISAAQVLISWSHPGRLRSEAAFATLADAAPIPA